MSTQVGPFLLEVMIGEGATSQVWRARREGTGELVALKLLRAEQRGRLGSLPMHEVEAVARLDHPGIVWVHDFGNDPAAGPWIALELLSGGSLKPKLPLSSWTSFADLARTLLETLGHAHARGVLHCDVKPGNVLLSTPEDGRPGMRLVDFGVAAVGHRRGPRAGSAKYAAPEQLSQANAAPTGLGPWTDLYGLGALLWHAATGAPPSVREEFSAPFPTPPGLESWLRGLLATQPAARPANAARALTAFLGLGVPRDAARPAIPTFSEESDTAAARTHPRLAPSSARLLAYRPVPMVGREPEQRALLDWLTRDGPALAEISGAEGIGKSALVGWFVTACRERDLAWVAHVELQSSRPLAEAMRNLGAPDLQVGPEQDCLPTLIRWAVQADRPVCVVIDPADREGEVTRLIQRFTGVRNLRVLVTRGPRPIDPGRGRALVSRVPDPRMTMRLGPVEGLRLARALRVEGSFAARIAAESAGNPGVAVAILRELVASGRVEFGRRGYTLPADFDLALPAGLANSARNHVSGLPVPPRLVVAAVLGTTVDRSWWESVCARLGLAPQPTEEAWYPWMRHTEQALVFDQPGVRAALLDAATPEWTQAIAVAAVETTADSSERAPLHAEWMARAGRRAEAVPLLVAASERLRDVRPDEAWRLLELASMGDEPPSLEIAVSRLLLLGNAGDLEAALAMQAPPGPELLQEDWRYLQAQLLCISGYPRRALEELRLLRPTSNRLAAKARMAIEAGDHVEARHWLANGDPNHLRHWVEMGVLALIERDDEAWQKAIAPITGVSARHVFERGLLDVVGRAVIRREDVSAHVDHWLVEANALNVQHWRLVLCAAALLSAVLHQPDQVLRRLEDASLAVSISNARLCLARDLFYDAAEHTTGARRDALLALAETQAPLEG